MENLWVTNYGSDTVSKIPRERWDRLILISSSLDYDPDLIGAIPW